MFKPRENSLKVCYSLAADEITVHVDSNRERIDSHFTPQEIVRGFVTLFRQMDANGEPASFHKVSSAIYKVAVQASDPASQQRRGYLTDWSKARGKLLAFNLRQLVRKRLSEEGLAAAGRSWATDVDSPHWIISRYNYGEYLHWDRHRETIATWAADPFDDVTRRMQFLNAVTGLAHLYIGYGVIVEGILNGNTKG